MDFIITMFVGQSLLIFILLVLLMFAPKRRDNYNESNGEMNSKDEMKRIKEEVEFDV